MPVLGSRYGRLHTGAEEESSSEEAEWAVWKKLPGPNDSCGCQIVSGAARST